jgi:phosphate-selective porin OprO/OprP
MDISRRNHAVYWACVFTLVIAGLPGAQAAAQTTKTGAAVSFGTPQPVNLEPARASSPVNAPPAAPPWPAGLGTPAPPEANCDLPEAAAPQPRRFALESFWENGLRVESADGQFHIHVGGNAQIDTVWLIGPQSIFAIPGGGTNGVGSANATQLRRARLRADGDIYGLFDYVVEYDFANAVNENSGSQPLSFNSIVGSPAPANVWMQIRDVPWLGNVRMGNQVKPIGMTNNTDQALLPFMERPDNMDAFYGPFDNGFALGITARNWTESERATWVYGVFQPLTNSFAIALNKVAFGGRVTALPWYEDDGRRLIHVGLGTWDGQNVQDEIRLRVRPLLRNGPGFAVPVIADTSQVPSICQYTIAPEFAMVLGPFTLQAEWTGQYVTNAFVNNQSQGTLFFHGGYVEALYFLTGEYQPYVKREGVFGRVLPVNDYSIRRGNLSGGCGAWQVGARFSYVNLNDRGVQGGAIYDWTFGVNWFLNPNMKLQLNYILEHRDGQQGVAMGWLKGVTPRRVNGLLPPGGAGVSGIAGYFFLGRSSSSNTSSPVNGAPTSSRACACCFSVRIDRICALVFSRSLAYRSARPAASLPNRISAASLRYSACSALNFFCWSSVRLSALATSGVVSW